MASLSLLDSIDLRTQLAGQNRLELLLFRLNGRQRYGINVFKVREVIQCPALTRLPRIKAVVRGVAHLRGRTVSVIDLGMALGKPAIADPASCFVIVTEYNRTTQGFLVHSVDRIINMQWESILPPPDGLGSSSYLTAVTRIDNELIEVIDVEKVLAEVSDISTFVSAPLKSEIPEGDVKPHVLVADDSGIARKQITHTLEQIRIGYFIAKNGREALEILKGWADECNPMLQQLLMVITDIEMPEMDGYTLTGEIKKDPRLSHLYVLLHSSLSGVFNKALVDKVGASEFLAKYSADELANVVLKRLQVEQTDVAVANY